VPQQGALSPPIIQSYRDSLTMPWQFVADESGLRIEGIGAPEAVKARETYKAGIERIRLGLLDEFRLTAAVKRAQQRKRVGISGACR
jgi:hypothetical protein